MAIISTALLTEATLEGSGVFDVLMRANKVYLDQEFSKNRIKGPEYATVYLGSLNSVLQSSVQFLLSKDKAANEALLIEAQIRLVEAQILKERKDEALIAAQAAKVIRETLLIDIQQGQIIAQTGLITQQTANAVVELQLLLGNISKVAAEVLNLGKLGAHTEAQTLHTIQQTSNAVSEKLLITANTSKVTAEILNVPKSGLLIEAQTGQVTQQTANAVIEGTVLVAQRCKLTAEYDLTMQATQKTVQEKALLAQKTVTELAQVSSGGVDPGSVIGRQNSLYLAQTSGYARDAEQKAAKIMVDTWSVRRSNDDSGAPYDDNNKLNDASIGRAVNKLLTGAGA